MAKILLCMLMMWIGIFLLLHQCCHLNGPTSIFFAVIAALSAGAVMSEKES